MRGDRATGHDHADDLVVLNLFDPELQETVVYEDPVSRFDILSDLLVGSGEPARVTQEIARRYDHPVTLDQLRPADYLTDPYLRSLDVLHHRHVAARRLSSLAHETGILQVPFVLAVAEVQTRHVHPEAYEIPYRLLRRGRGT